MPTVYAMLVCPQCHALYRSMLNASVLVLMPQVPLLMACIFDMWSKSCPSEYGCSRSYIRQALFFACFLLAALPFFMSPLKHFYLDVCFPRIQRMFEACCWCATSFSFRALSMALPEALVLPAQASMFENRGGCVYTVIAQTMVATHGHWHVATCTQWCQAPLKIFHEILVCEIWNVAARTRACRVALC